MIVNTIINDEYQGADYDFCINVFSRHPELFREIFGLEYGSTNNNLERVSVSHNIEPPYSKTKVIFFHSKFGAIWFNQVDYEKIHEFITTVPNIYQMNFGYICGTFSPLGPTNMRGMLSAHSAQYYQMWIQCNQF